LKAKHESSDEEDEDEASDTDTETDFQSEKNNSKAAAGDKAEFEIVTKDEGKCRLWIFLPVHSQSSKRYSSSS
jgi:hypothetical protein